MQVRAATNFADSSALERRLHEAWEHLRRVPAEEGSLRAQLLAQPWAEVWRIEESPSRSGIAGNEGEFLIILRDLGGYLVDVATAAVADRLVAEAVEWLKRKYGADSIEIGGGNDDKNKRR